MKANYIFEGIEGREELTYRLGRKRGLLSGNSWYKWYPNDDGKFMCEHECMVLDAIADIPGVVVKFDSGTLQIDGNDGSRTLYPAIKTSYHKGKTLDLLWNSKQRDDFEIPVLLHFCKEVLGTLTQIEKRSVLHNDLQPHNIIKTDVDKYVIIDFDNAVWIGEAVEERFIRSAPGYAAPEKKEGIITSASDVFSFGVLLNKFYKRGAQLGVKYPEELKSIISRATSEKSTERYQTLEEFLEAVTAFEEQLQKKEDKKEEHANETENICSKQEADKEEEILTTAKKTRSFDWTLGIYRLFTVFFVIAAAFFFSLGVYILVRPDDGTPLLVNGYPSIKNDIEIVYNDIKKAGL